jgi:hypothetical protein
VPDNVLVAVAATIEPAAIILHRIRKLEIKSAIRWR